MHLIYSDGYSKKKKTQQVHMRFQSSFYKIQFISRSYSRIDYSSDVRLINRFFYQALQIALKKIHILRQLAYKQLDRGEMIPLTSLAKVINYTRRKMLISHITSLCCPRCLSTCLSLLLALTTADFHGSEPNFRLLHQPQSNNITTCKS